MAIQRLRLYLKFENNYLILESYGASIEVFTNRIESREDEKELKAEDENENNYSNLSTLSKLVLESNI